jgi:hypothetical protein
MAAVKALGRMFAPVPTQPTPQRRFDRRQLLTNLKAVLLLRARRRYAIAEQVSVSANRPA